MTNRLRSLVHFLLDSAAGAFPMLANSSVGVASFGCFDYTG